MSYGEFVRRTLTVVFIVGVCMFLVTAISELVSILLIVFTCWVISVGINSAIRNVQRLGIKRIYAIPLTLVGLVLVFVLAFSIILPPFVTQTKSLVNGLPNAVVSLVETYEKLRADNELAANTLPEFTVEDYNKLIDTAFEDVVVDDDTIAAIDLTRLVGSALPLLGGIGSFIGNVFANFMLIVIITSYLVMDPLVYYRPIIAIVPASKEQRVIELVDEVREKVVTWMGALSVSITVTSVMVTVALGVILRIPNAFALGLMAGLTTFIPNLGYYIGLIPIFIFAAASDPVKAIPAAILYWLINEFEGKVISPAVIKSELNIPAGVILPFQLIAASVFGFFGILLAVPMLAIAIALVQELYVYDTLGKRGRLPKIVDRDGDLLLEYPSTE